MAKKEIVQQIKLQIPAGQANPSPPVGPALGQAGLNIMDFCKAFNDATKGLQGPIPVVIYAYKDRSFDFIKRLPPVSYFIKQSLKLKKGSQRPGQDGIGAITATQVCEIAQQKMEDLNAHTLFAAAQMVAGTARSMGLEVQGDLAAEAAKNNGASNAQADAA